MPSTLRKVVKKLDFLKPHFALRANSVYCLQAPSLTSRLNSAKR